MNLWLHLNVVDCQFLTIVSSHSFAQCALQGIVVVLLMFMSSDCVHKTIKTDAHKITQMENAHISMGCIAATAAVCCSSLNLNAIRERACILCVFECAFDGHMCAMHFVLFHHNYNFHFSKNKLEKAQQIILSHLSAPIPAIKNHKNN